jgi:hypothetical protein
VNLATESYAAQKARWPKAGRHVLAQFDAEGIVVYQAFRPQIAEFAVANQHLDGGGFSLSRMSWIKTNFLWMMFRCGWASKENQERVLALTIKRGGFDAILARAVPSTFVPRLYATPEEWQSAGKASSVRLQWDPDHTPTGEKLERRAIQLGLRGGALARYAKDDILSIQDITPFVHEQFDNVRARDYDALLTPREDLYPVPEALMTRLGMGDEQPCPNGIE